MGCPVLSVRQAWSPRLAPRLVEAHTGGQGLGSPWSGPPTAAPWWPVGSCGVAQRSHLWGRALQNPGSPFPGLETEARGAHTQASWLRAEAGAQAAGQQQLRPPPPAVPRVPGSPWLPCPRPPSVASRTAPPPIPSGQGRQMPSSLTAWMKKEPLSSPSSSPELWTHKQIWIHQ